MKTFFIKKYTREILYDNITKNVVKIINRPYIILGIYYF